MDGKKEFERLLSGLIDLDLTTEEKAGLWEAFNQSTDKKRFFEEIESVWRLAHLQSIPLSDEAIEHELEKFKAALESRKGLVISMKPSLNPVIREERLLLPKWTGLLKAGVAAAIIFCVVIGVWMSWNAEKDGVNPVVSTRPTIEKPVLFIRQINNTKQPQQLLLEDGSQVTLYPNSEMDYARNFERNRHLLLKGKASFKVVKNKSRPFTVTSGELMTTALGTEFLITAMEKAPVTSILLKEGSVVIRSAPSAQRRLKRDYYLKPGDELLFEKESGYAKVLFRKSNKQPEKEVTNKDDPEFVDSDTRPWFMFNNQPLATVLGQLEVMYHVEIIYSKKDIEHVRFIGKFYEHDSIGTILQQIALLNQLKLERVDRQFKLLH